MYRHFPTGQDLIVADKRELALSVTDRRSALFAEWHEAMAHGADRAQRDRLLAVARNGVMARRKD